MTPRATIIAHLGCITCAFVAGFYIAKGTITSRTEIIEKVKYSERQEDLKAARDESHIAIREQRITRPDGTVIETKRSENITKREVVERKQSEQAKTTTKSTKSVAATNLPQYRLSWHARIGDVKDWRISGGRRLVGPIWGEASVSRGGEVTLGLGIEW